MNHEFRIEADRALVGAYFGDPREDAVREVQRMTLAPREGGRVGWGTSPKDLRVID